FFSSRRRHTRFSRDWSSDVCSSDLKSEFNENGQLADTSDVLEVKINTDKIKRLNIEEAAKMKGTPAELTYKLRNEGYDGVELVSGEKRELIIFDPGNVGVKVNNFDKWFSGSKIIDNNGKPLVVYHGSDKDFDTFKPKSLGTYGDHEYYYFAANKTWVKNFAKEEPFDNGDKFKIKKYFLS